MTEKEFKLVIHQELHRATLEKIPNWKTPTTMEYVDSSFRNSHPAMTDWPCNWVNAYKKQTYPNGWQNRKQHRSRKTLKKHNSQQLQYNNVFIYDMENFDRTDKRRNPLLAHLSRNFSGITKKCHRGTGGTNDLLYIDLHLFKEVKTKRKNRAMAWIYSRNVCDTVPQTCKIGSENVQNIPQKIMNFIMNAMENWRGKFTARGQILAEVIVQKSLFQGDSLAPLISIIIMMPVNYILR